MPHMTHASNLKTTAIRYILASTLLYVAGDILIKSHLKSLPAIEVVLFRNVFGLLALLALSGFKGISLWGEKPWLLYSRGIFGVLSLIIFYYLISHGALANAVVFLQSAAIFTALFAYMQSAEKLSAWQVVALLLGLVGVGLVVKPNVQLTPDALAGVLLAVVSALAMTSIKELNKHYNANSIVCSYFMVGILFPAGLLAYNAHQHVALVPYLQGEFQMPGAWLLLILVALALSTTLGQLYKTKAYAMHKAGVISTLSYSRIAFALVAGLALGDALPDGWAMLGMGLIVWSAWRAGK
jgi:drug/metabolite transporter (DMT)-like permease